MLSWFPRKLSRVCQHKTTGASSENIPWSVGCECRRTPWQPDAITSERPPVVTVQ